MRNVKRTSQLKLNQSMGACRLRSGKTAVMDSPFAEHLGMIDRPIAVVLHANVIEGVIVAVVLREETENTLWKMRSANHPVAWSRGFRCG